MLKKLTFQPGVNKEGTDYSAEGGWYSSDLVRFRKGRPEKIGGWSKLSESTIHGICRKMHNWSALDSSDYMGLGTSDKVYVELGGTFYDITPTYFTRTTTLTANIDSSVTSLPVENGSAFADGDLIKIDNEYMIASGAGTSSSIPVVGGRGEFNSTAAEHEITNKFWKNTVSGFPVCQPNSRVERGCNRNCEWEQGHPIRMPSTQEQQESSLRYLSLVLPPLLALRLTISLLLLA